MFFYVGPDQIMPVASVMATIVGFLLIFWNRFLGVLGRIAGRFKRPPKP